MQHKCFKCGTKFDGNFCPECGEKWQESKTCPKCGATLAGNAKFCNECGYSFAMKAQTQNNLTTPTSIPNFGADRQKTILYAVCLYLPYALIALFSVLLFFFYLAPVAVMPGGHSLA